MYLVLFSLNINFIYLSKEFEDNNGIIGFNIDDFVSNTKKDKSLIVYCYHGNSSQSAAEFLVKSGFNDVYSLDGGYEAWEIRK